MLYCKYCTGSASGALLWTGGSRRGGGNPGFPGNQCGAGDLGADVQGGQYGVVSPQNQDSPGSIKEYAADWISVRPAGIYVQHFQHDRAGSPEPPGCRYNGGVDSLWQDRQHFLDD